MKDMSFDDLRDMLLNRSCHDRIAAARSLRTNYPDESGTLLIQVLKSIKLYVGDPSSRYRGITPSERRNLLADDTQEEFLLQEIAMSLAMIGDPEAIPALAEKLEAFGQPNANDKTNAAVSLAIALIALGQPASPHLKRLLNMSNARITRSIVHARRTWKEVAREQALHPETLPASLEILKKVNDVETLGP